MVNVPTMEDLALVVKDLTDLAARIVKLESTPTSAPLPQEVKDALKVLAAYIGAL